MNDTYQEDFGVSHVEKGRREMLRLVLREVPEKHDEESDLRTHSETLARFHNVPADKTSVCFSIDQIGRTGGVAVRWKG